MNLHGETFETEARLFAYFAVTENFQSGYPYKNGKQPDIMIKFFKPVSKITKRCFVDTQDDNNLLLPLISAVILVFPREMVNVISCNIKCVDVPKDS